MTQLHTSPAGSDTGGWPGAADDPQPLVSPDGSRVSRRLFSDEQLYRAELKNIFGRSWLFVAHESQIPQPGDFVLSRMGEESVIVSRGTDRSINVLLNSCAHRGMPICRADLGSTKSFTCPYHAWSYSVEGRLIGVPHQVDGYDRQIDKSAWGLRRARVDSYAGLIFATFDHAAPTLDEFLGDIRWYLDLAFDRDADGTCVLAGVHRWIIDCNWKVPAENHAADVYHGDFSHASVFSLTGTTTTAGFPDGVQVTTDSGHFIVVDRVPPDADEKRLVPLSSTAPHVLEWSRSVQPVAEERLGPGRIRLRPVVGTLFPNFMFLPSAATIRIAHPLGVGRTEMWSWCLVPAAAPAEVRRTLRDGYLGGFGPAGLIEQEDGENWTEMTRASSSSLPEERLLHVGMGLGQERTDPDMPGILGPLWSEHNQRSYYRTWARHMASEGWVDG
jgi:phenylpropionate dioxygenase-like ring-hydroxylating dioxygenase large terminal subunit